MSARDTTPSAHQAEVPAPEAGVLTYTTLREANVARQAAWCPDQLPDLSFRGNELGGEVGEALNVIKKLERERHGWRGSRDTVDHLAEELADVVICTDLVAITAGIDLDAAVRSKFNATSEKVGLPHRLALSAHGQGAGAAVLKGWSDDHDRAFVAISQDAFEAYREDYVFSPDDGSDHVLTEWEGILAEDFVQGYLVSLHDALRKGLPLAAAPRSEPAPARDGAPAALGGIPTEAVRGLNALEEAMHEMLVSDGDREQIRSVVRGIVNAAFARDTAPAAPGGDGVEAALDAFGAAVQAYADRLRHDTADDDRTEEAGYLGSIKDARGDVLDAVRALQATPADVAGLDLTAVERALDSFAIGAGLVALHMKPISSSSREDVLDAVRAVTALARRADGAAAGVAVVPSRAAQDVFEERERQINVEGWTPEHDDAHDDGQLALAAVCYALPEYQQSIKTAAHPTMRQSTIVERLWPWSPDWWKPIGERRDLVKAGALILAEIERLDRADLRARIEAADRPAGSADGREG